MIEIAFLLRNLQRIIHVFDNTRLLSLKRKSILDYKLERISDIQDASYNLTTSISKNEWSLLFKQFWKALESKLIFPHAQNC